MDDARSGAMERSHFVKIIVIGAGMGGMMSAARLAKAGHQVSLYEASDRVGGKLRTEWIGKELGLLCEIKAVDPSFDYHFADGTSVKFANLSRYHTLNNLRAVYGEPVARQWDQLMRRAEKMWDVSREPFIENELRSPLSLLKRFSLIRDLKIIAPSKTLRDFATEELSDGHLRYILDRYATYSGSDPRKAPAVLSTIAYVEESFGAWHIKGGLGTLATLVHERAEKVGVIFHLNSPVASIDVKKGKARGITLDSGEVIESDAVIANADASLIYNTLIKAKIRKIKKVRKNIAKADPSLAGFSLLLGMRKDGSMPLNHHTVLFPKDYDAEFDAIFTHKQPLMMRQCLKMNC
jgi:phytoene dehydrogenase-like protein